MSFISNALSISGGNLTGPIGLASYTWATIPAAGTAGRMIFISDAGTKGSTWFDDGAHWKPLNNQALLGSLDTPSAGVNASETIAFQYKSPAAFWQLTNRLRLIGTLSKSGTTNSGVLNIRIGTAGTTGDSIVLNSTVLSAGNRQVSFIYDIRIESATTVQLMNNVSGYGTATSTALASATTISNISNALWFNVTITGGATDTVSLTDAQLWLIAGAN